MNRYVCMVAGAALACGIPFASGAASMPAAQQNALTQTYCTVCHDDAHRNGGLSLQHFDAAHADPGVAAMMVSKLKTGAIGASGTKPPDRATLDAWTDSMEKEAAGADRWIVARAGSEISAGIVRSVPSWTPKAIVPDSYRLTVTCRADAGQGEIRLAWSPATPDQGQEMSASFDGAAPAIYKIEGHETMGNGNKGDSGPGSIVLHTPSLPANTIVIRNAFPEETVSFPFTELAPGDRHALSACFPAP
jgi:cytochrome c551/c552